MKSLANFYQRLEDHGTSFNWSEPVTGHSLDTAGETPLHWAAYWGEAATIVALVAAGADVNVPGEFDNSPLHYVAERNSVSAIEALLAAGASPNVVNALGETPSEHAASLSNHEAVESLALRT